MARTGPTGREISVYSPSLLWTPLVTDDVEDYGGGLGCYEAAVDCRAGDGGSLVLGGQLGEEEGAGHQATHAVHGEPHRRHRHPLLSPGEGGGGVAPPTAAVELQAGADLQGVRPHHNLLPGLAADHRLGGFGWKVILSVTLRPGRAGRELTDQLELDPGVPGGRGLVVHPAPVLAAVPRHHRVQVEGGAAGVRALLVVDVASLRQHPLVFPVLASARAGPQVKTKNNSKVAKAIQVWVCRHNFGYQRGTQFWLHRKRTKVGLQLHATPPREKLEKLSYPSLSASSDKSLQVNAWQRSLSNLLKN